MALANAIYCRLGFYLISASQNDVPIWIPGDEPRGGEANSCVRPGNHNGFHRGIPIRRALIDCF
jgi:hypothetical protein